ncbi:MAG TPA: type II toxin-antitoxin system prevent-host-death family antitoxin [Verrucomicrobiae bacterium]|jgi:prevent-host-death family protein|nr:type II toxin-antitoxin system prevent-host-death family antitoxin [Verrucomicrobiae bacterium]
MRTVGSRELKNRLGAYLKLVGKGETLVVTDRGKPVARIVPADSAQVESKTLDQVLKEMEARGHLRLGTRPFKRFKPVRTKGKPASQMIIEDRV